MGFHSKLTIREVLASSPEVFIALQQEWTHNHMLVAVLMEWRR
jgi:hypothetical protein